MAARAERALDAAPSRELINGKDLGTAATLLVLWVAVELLPESAVRGLCGVLARIHIALRGSKAGELSGVQELADAGTDLAKLERQILKRSYEEMAQPLLERRRSGWHPQIDLEGGDHIQRALDKGHGAVLWVVPSFSGEMVLRKSMKAAGFPLVDLRVADHPYSGTRFGRRFLNPIRLQVENRYMTGRAIVDDFAPSHALQELQQHLKQNRVVNIMAGGNSGRPAMLRCFNGELSLALGAPALASIAKAPLMPAFVEPTRSGGYVVRIGAPMEIEGRRPGRSAWDALAAAYLAQMKEHVLRYPDQWQSWYDRSSWKPDPVAGHGSP